MHENERGARDMKVKKLATTNAGSQALMPAHEIHSRIHFDFSPSDKGHGYCAEVVDLGPPEARKARPTVLLKEWGFKNEEDARAFCRAWVEIKAEQLRKREILQRQRRQALPDVLMAHAEEFSAKKEEVKALNERCKRIEELNFACVFHTREPQLEIRHDAGTGRVWIVDLLTEEIPQKSDQMVLPGLEDAGAKSARVGGMRAGLDPDHAFFPARGIDGDNDADGGDDEGESGGRERDAK